MAVIFETQKAPGELRELWRVAASRSILQLASRKGRQDGRSHLRSQHFGTFVGEMTVDRDLDFMESGKGEAVQIVDRDSVLLHHPSGHRIVRNKVLDGCPYQ